MVVLGSAAHCRGVRWGAACPCCLRAGKRRSLPSAPDQTQIRALRADQRGRARGGGEEVCSLFIESEKSLSTSDVQVCRSDGSSNSQFGAVACSCVQLSASLLPGFALADAPRGGRDNGEHFSNGDLTLTPCQRRLFFPFLLHSSGCDFELRASSVATRWRLYLVRSTRSMAYCWARPPVDRIGARWSGGGVGRGADGEHAPRPAGRGLHAPDGQSVCCAALHRSGVVLLFRASHPWPLPRSVSGHRRLGRVGQTRSNMGPLRAVRPTAAPQPDSRRTRRSRRAAAARAESAAVPARSWWAASWGRGCGPLVGGRARAA